MQSAPLAPALPLQPSLKTAVAYAGFWRRALAYLIDIALLSIVQSTLTAAAFVLSPQNFSFSFPSGNEALAYAIAWDIIAIGEKLINVALVGWAITWAYYSILESSPARATLGKAVVGIYVGDLNGDPITFWRASVRYWLKTLSSLVLMLGWFMAAFTPRKQALHDLLSGCLVLRKVSYVAPRPGEGDEPGEYWDGRRWVGAVPVAQER